MQLTLPYYDYDLKVTQSDKVAIEKLISASLAEFKGKKEELEVLTLECISNISNSSSISAELSEQGVLKRLWGDITGKNRKMRVALYRNTANTQYAQQQILVKLIEQNATVMDFIAAIHKENHTITLDIKQQQLDTNNRLQQVCLHLIEHRNAVVRLNEQSERLSSELDHVVFICPHCGSFISRKSRVCHQCGHILITDDSPLSTAAGADRFKDDMVSLSAVIKETQNMKNAISTSKLDWYRRKIRQIRCYVDKVDLPADIRKNVLKKCNKFERFLEKQHIEIAIAGTVKAGKSSLINALLNTEFATVDATPETSVLAKYRTTSGKSYLKVRFYSETLWKKVWAEAQRSTIYIDEYQELHAGAERDKWVGRSDYISYGLEISELQSELSKFTSSKSPVHFFVREVEVGIHSNLFPNDVYLVDTPGLDDVVATRSNVTKEYLDKADAVLACIKEKDIHEASETKFVSRVMANRREWETLFVVATQKDLDKPSDFEKNRDHFVNKVLNPMFNPSESEVGGKGKKFHAERQFFGISAKMYTDSLLYEQGALNEEDYDEYVSILRKAGYRNEAAFPEKIDNIKKDSGIPFLKQNLENRLFRSTRKILYARMDDAFQDFLKQIHDIVVDGTEVCDERLELLASNETTLVEIRKKLDEVGNLVSQIKNYMEQIRQIVGGEK